MLITYDPDYGLATITGPGGFTQLAMTENRARAIATALQIEFRVHRVIVTSADGR